MEEGSKLTEIDISKLKQADRIAGYANDPAATPEVIERIRKAQEFLRKGPLEKVTPKIVRIGSSNGR